MTQKIANQKKENFIPALTGIRAIAAYCVFLFHFNPFEKTSFWWPYFNELHIGVDIFFVLSGFLITYRYYESHELNRKWFGKYLINRVARIYPMFFILTIITFVVTIILVVTGNKNFTLIQVIKHYTFEFLMNVTFLKGFFNDLKFTGIPQGWTLTVEECFYFAAPIIFIFSKKFLLWIQPLLLLILGFTFVYFFGAGKVPQGFFYDIRFMWIFTIFGKSFEFFLGIYLAKCLLKNKELFKRIKYLTLTGVTLIALSIILIAQLKNHVFPPFGGVIFINYILPIFICCLFYGLIKEETFLNKILSTKIFVNLGKSSYIFYLIHMGVFQLLISKYISGNTLLIFIILNIISFLLFYYLEDPLNQMIKRQYQHFQK